MTQPAFTPALGRFGAGWLYDAVVALTGERGWRRAACRELAAEPGDVVVDVGCGSGSQSLMVYALQPQARIVGVDPDVRMLALARRKAEKVSAPVEFRSGMGDALAAVLPDVRADKVISSLVLHQCPLPMKRAILASMHEVLKPGGRLVIADFGRQRSWLMRAAFLIVQMADGFADTQPNADGVLPDLMRQAGFGNVREAQVIPTLVGAVTVYVAEKV